MNSSENGVFCARGVNGMHAMGLPCIFAARPPLQCPFRPLCPLQCRVQVITWVGGSSKLPRPVGEQTFLHSFQNSQLQRLLPPSSFLHPSSLHRIESPFGKLFTSSGRKVQMLALEAGHRERGGGFCPRFFSAVFASNLFIVRPRSVLGARSA